MPRRQAQTGSLGKRARGYGNPSVSMATAVLTQLLPPHLGKYPTIRKGHVLLYAGWIMKYSQGVDNSLSLPPYSSAFHLSLIFFGKEMLDHYTKFLLDAFL